MTPFKPVLLEAVGVPDGHTLASYRSRGGYAPLEKLLKEYRARAARQRAGGRDW